MATEQYYYNKLKLTAGFSDGDDRNISLDDPLPDLTKETILTVGASLSGVLIGDKDGADFLEIKNASYVAGSVTEITL